MVEGLFKNGLNQTRGKMQDVSSNSQGCEMVFEVVFIIHILVENTPSPHNAVFASAVSTYTDFGQCMCKWGKSPLIESLVQSY